MKIVNWLRQKPDRLAVFGLATIVVLLWFPFGLDTLPDVESWHVMNLADKDGFYTSYFESTARPLVPLPWKLASLVVPYPFIGPNLLLALVFFGKAVLLYFILGNLKIGNPGARFIAALLFIIFPADEGNFALRLLHYHFSLSLYLLAVYCLTRYCVKSQPIYVAGFSALVLVISCLIYEVVVPLAIFTPLLLIYFGKVSRPEKFQAMGFWYLALIGHLIFYFTRPLEYQSMRFAAGSSAGGFVSEIIQGFIRAYLHGFWDSWVNSINKLFSEPAYGIFALFIALIAAVVAYLLTNEKTSFSKKTLKPNAWATLLGLVAFGLAFSLYTLADTRDATIRVFLYASMGGGMAIAFFLALASNKLGRYQSLIFASTSFILVLAAAHWGLVQKSEFVVVSDRQREALASLTSQATGIDQDATLIILMENAVDRPFNNIKVISTALAWVFSREMNARMCFAVTGNCTFEGKNIRVKDHQQPELLNETFASDQVVLFFYNPGAGMRVISEITGFPGYDPNDLIDIKATLPDRANYLSGNIHPPSSLKFSATAENFSRSRNQFDEASLAEQDTLASLVSAAPTVSQDATLIVVMQRISQRPYANSLHFTNAVSWLYGMNLNVRMCFLDRANCRAEGNQMAVDDIQYPANSGQFASDRIIILSYDPEAGFKIVEDFPGLDFYRPKQLFDAEGPSPIRALNLLGNNFFQR